MYQFVVLVPLATAIGSRMPLIITRGSKIVNSSKPVVKKVLTLCRMLRGGWI